MNPSGGPLENLPEDGFWTWGRDGLHLLSCYWSIHPEKGKWGLWVKELDLRSKKVRETFYEARFAVDRHSELSVSDLLLAPDRTKLLIEGCLWNRLQNTFQGTRLYIAHLSEKRVTRIITSLRYLEGHFHWFPHSRQVGYLQAPSNAEEGSDLFEVWVSRTDGEERHKVGWIPAEEGIAGGEKGSDCVWSPDGSRIAFTADLEGKKKERPVYLLTLNLPTHLKKGNKREGKGN